MIVMYRDVQRKFFTHGKQYRSDKKYWVQESNTEDVFDELVALSKQDNRSALQNTSRVTVYDTITSGEEDFLDNSKWIPNRNKRRKTAEFWNGLRKNTRNEKQENINISLYKRKFFKTKTSQLDGDFHSKFGSYSREAVSHQSSRTSEHSSGRLKHNKPRFHYPMIISDASSDEDDTLCEEKFDKRRSYHFTIYDPECELANQMHRKIFRNRKQIQNSYSQKNDHMKSNSPKKQCVKRPLDNVKKNNLQLRRITSRHSVKYSLPFQKHNSQSHRITSVKEGNHTHTLQSNTQEQTLCVKNKVLTERITQTDTPQKANQGRTSFMKDSSVSPEMTYVRKLEIQNQKREIEYLRAILEDDVSTTDLNSLCTYKENDVEVQLLLNMNQLPTGKDKEIESREVLLLLPSNEDPVLPFFPTEEKSSSEIICTTTPPAVDLTLLRSSPEIRKTSTPVSSQDTGINFSISPIMYSRRLGKTSSVSAYQFEIHRKNSHSLPSPAVENIQSDKYKKPLREKKKMKNSAEMGFPNPIGTNKCWMNSSLQVVFGMKPFIEDLVNVFEKSNIVESKGKYSSLLETFIEVVKARQTRNQSQLNKNLELLYKTLGVLNEHFTTHSQEDAVEFLTEFLTALREEFYRLMCSNEVYVALKDSCRQEQNSNNASDMNTCPKGESSMHIQLQNPVSENIIFKLKEIQSCMMCSKQESKETEHLTLIVNIPSETLREITLQEALESCMMTEIRELKCAQCESEQCRVKTVFTLLPRFLVLHVNRFEMQNNVIKKLCKYLKIPITLTVRNVISESEMMMPRQWMSANNKRFSWPEERDTGSSSSRRNNEDEKFQHTVQLSTEDLNAIKNKQEYTLLAIISHKGDTPNSGHYEADVYNLTTRKWNHYNDEIVTSRMEEEVTSFSQQENGYAFLYMYKPLFSQLVNEQMMSRNFENE